MIVVLTLMFTLLLVVCMVLIFQLAANPDGRGQAGMEKLAAAMFACAVCVIISWLTDWYGIMSLVFVVLCWSVVTVYVNAVRGKY